MSAFGDFGPLSERRKAEKAQKQRKQMLIASATVSVVIIVAAVVTASVIYLSKKGEDDGGGNNKDTDTGASPKTTAVTTSKIVDTVCSNTDHKESCTSTLLKATNSTSKPKDVIKASVSVVHAAVDPAFGLAKTFQSDDPLVHGAVAVCDQMLEDSNLDLSATMDQIEARMLEELPKIGPMLNIWLSAVRTYQETCVDAFIDGPNRDKMEAAMKDVNERTTDAIAIVTKLGKFVSSIDDTGNKQRLLLAEEEDALSADDEELPSWDEEEDRRVLVEVKLMPNLIVAQDGSGHFRTITEALKAIPADRRKDERYVIYVKAGLYDEQVNVTKAMVNITMYGDGYDRSIVTGSKNFGKDKIQTMHTASFDVSGDGFMGINMGFHNTAGPEGHQAVALHVNADCVVFLSCRMDAYQNTLYAHAKRQYYRDCIITGTVEYIFGNANAIFQNCVFAVRRPGPGQQNIITAHGREEAVEGTGFIVHNCKIIPGEELEPVKSQFKTYLARPWKPYSRTVFMETEIGMFVEPVGYLPRNESGNIGQDTCMYGEYKNEGPGADTAQRADWKGVHKELTPDEAKQYTASAFVFGIATWIQRNGVDVPLRLGLFGS